MEWQVVWSYGLEEYRDPLPWSSKGMAQLYAVIFRGPSTGEYLGTRPTGFRVESIVVLPADPAVSA